MDPPRPRIFIKEEPELANNWDETRHGDRATVESRIEMERAARDETDKVEIPRELRQQFQRWTQNVATNLLCTPRGDYWWQVTRTDFRPFLAKGDLFFFGGCDIPDHPHPGTARARNILIGHVSNPDKWSGAQSSMVVIRRNRDLQLQLPPPQSGPSVAQWHQPIAPAGPPPPKLAPAALPQAWQPPPPPPQLFAEEPQQVPPPPPPPPLPNGMTIVEPHDDARASQLVPASVQDAPEVVPSQAQAKTSWFVVF